jgi:carbonic anhydrase
MKYAKVVVLGQLVLAAVLVAVLIFKPRPVPAGDHSEPAAAVASAHAAGPAAPADKAKPEKTQHGRAPATPEKADPHKAPAHGESHGGEHEVPVKAAAEPHGADKGEGAALPGHDKDPRAIARALLMGNGRFMTGESAHPDLLQQVQGSKDGQHPGAMILGCADSRVPPELIFDRGIGELFVVRSAGNVAEPVSTASLEYAAEHLHVKVLVVLGHEKCGAVQAALAGGKLPSDDLQTLVKYITPAVKGLKSWAEGADLVRFAVEANVRHQASELLRRSRLLRHAVRSGEVTLLKAVYDLETGRVRPL